MTVSLEALTAELAQYGVELQTTAADSLTAREWAKHWKLSVHAARKLILSCIEQGLMQSEHGYRNRPMDGRLQQMPVYRWLKPVKTQRSKRGPTRPKRKTREHSG